MTTCTLPSRPATLLRDAVPSDLPAVRAVLRAAYEPYAGSLPPPMFRAYLDDVLDVRKHAGAGGQVIVAEVAGRILATAVFYPDASVLGFGLPQGWASGRTMGVHPAGRGHGLARALLAEFEVRARAVGAPVFAFHTASFMAAAVRLYEGLGYRRAPELDVDMGARYGVAGGERIVAIGYRHDLTTRESG